MRGIAAGVVWSLLSSLWMASAMAAVSPETELRASTRTGLAGVGASASQLAEWRRESGLGYDGEASGSTLSAKAAAPEPPSGSFSVSDWTGYPGDAPRPSGPFRLLEGSEYEAARAAADRTNRALHTSDPAKYAGKQIHEIHPVKFGGSPTDLANKVALTPKQHAAFTTFWNRLMRTIR